MNNSFLENQILTMSDMPGRIDFFTNKNMSFEEFIRQMGIV